MACGSSPRLWEAAIVSSSKPPDRSRTAWIVALWVLVPALVFAAGETSGGRGEPWDGPAFSAEPAAVLAAAAALPAPEEAQIEVLLVEVEHTLDREGQVAARTRRVYRVLNAAALDGWWSTLRVEWAPWYQERPEVRARVVAPDGSARELDPATVAEAAVPGRDPSMYEDTRSLRAPLPGVAVGAVVETEVTVRRQRPFFAAGESRRLLLSEYAPARRSRVVIDLPAGMELRLEGHELAAPTRRLEGGRERIVFEAADLASLDDREPWLPPEAPRIGPYVDYATGRSWAAVAAAYGELVEERLAGGGVEVLLDGLGDPGADRDAWLARLLTRLHRRVRYTGVEFDDARIVPRAPAETLARGFGDCKDKAVLLVAALRRAGIPAHVALLKSGYYRSQLDPAMPGLGEFNHAIVHLPGEPAMWIDATDPFSRPGELAVADQGRLALVIAPETTGLVRIPEASAADNRISIVRDIYLAETGLGRVVETAEFHGATAAGLRARLHGETRDQLEERFEQYVESVYGDGELTTFEIGEPDDLSTPMRQRLEIAEVKVVVTDAEQAVVVLRLASLFQHLPAILVQPSEEPREHEFAWDRPYAADWAYHVHLPPGLVVRSLPANAENPVGPGVFRRSYEIAEDGRRIDARIGLELDRRLLTGDEFNRLREDIQRLDKEKAANAVIWFDHSVNAHLAAGRLPEAIAEAQRLMALHPDEARHAGQLARALLAGSLGAEARRAARLGTELEPDAATAWALLGRVLLHDEVGRRFQPGWDREAAVAALRKAAELDPDDHSVRGDLAIALEHDEDGRRYGEGSDLEDALAIYREISDHLQAVGIANNLAIVLLKAGHYQEMREASERLADEATRNSFLVVAVALTDGPAAAVREAERRYPDAEARATALGSAAEDLLLLRRYSESAELTRTAARLSPRAATLLATAEVVGRAVPYEQLIADESDPKNVLVRFLAILMAAEGEPAAAELHRLFAGVIREHTAPEDLEPLMDVLRQTLQGGLDGLPPEVTVDLAAAAISISAQGNDELGHRIRFHGGIGGNHVDLVWLMVREGRALRVVAALAEDPSPIGLEVLRRVDAGDLAGARQWLDWALDRDWSPGQVGDPFSADAFPHFWSKSGTGRDEPGVMRLAGAVLAAPRGSERGIAVLEAARDGETGLQQARIDEALLQSYTTVENAEGVATAVGRLRERIVGESEVLFIQAVAALHAVDRGIDFEPLAGERLAAHPDDPWSLRLLADRAQELGDVARAAELYERLFATGDEMSVDLNNAAWIALAAPTPPTPRHIELSQRAIALDGGESATLHTLAALLAVGGQPAEARRVLVQSIEAKTEGVESHDFYVLGLLAEAYGLPEAAERYYQRTLDEAPEDARASAVSTASLARARIEALRARAQTAR
jgi:transglutaminase-like putative cysteine protease/tetratricopeptide (TPR) repeat protein